MLILTGVVTWFYALGNVVRFLLEGELRTAVGQYRLEGHMRTLREHYIVCEYGVLTARGLNNDLHIVARAGEEGSEQKLLRAGANRVSSPYQVGGTQVAQALLRPAVVDFPRTCHAKRASGCADRGIYRPLRLTLRRSGSE